MKAVSIIGLLVFLLITLGSASADVILAEASTHAGNIQVDVSSKAGNSTITFLNQSTGANSAGVNSAGVNSAGVNSAGINSAGINSAGINSAGINNTGINNTGVNNTGNSASSNENSALSLEKSAFPTTYDSVGQKITYSYIVKNTGNVPINDLKVTDDKLGIVSTTSTAFETGQIITVAAVYTITQADLDAGFVTSTAYAAGTFKGNHVRSEARLTLSADKPALILEKTAFPETYDTIGQTITYTYKVTNSGNVKISGPITVSDSRVNKSTPFELSKDDLPIGGQITFPKIYTITSDDLKSDSMVNVAYATGIYNGKEVKSNDTSVIVTADKPALTIEESAVPINYSTVGQTIEYKYVVTNTGNKPISGLKVTDDKFGLVSAPSTDLEPYNSITVTAIHTINQNDLDSGSVTHQANATGAYNGKEVKSNTGNVTVKADVQIPEFPSILMPVLAILGLIFISFSKRKEE